MDSKIQNRLNQELIIRSYSSPIGFIAVVSIFLFFQFGAAESQNKIYFLVASVVILSLVRLYYYKKYYKKNVPSHVIHKIYLLISLNALTFSMILFTVWSDRGIYSAQGLIGIAIILTLLAGSMVTLSTSTILHAIFTTSTLLPLIIYILIQHKMEAFRQPFFWLAFLQIAYNLHQGYQNKLYIIEKIKADLSLEEANQNLKTSQQNLIEQTAKSVHSSRLASLGEMASGIAHEVNNPLAIIHASTEHLQRIANDEEKDNPRFKNSTQKIQNAVNRIERIVRGLRTFSKQSDLNPMIQVSVNSLIKDTLDLCAEKFRLHDIDLILNCPNDYEIECRAIQISQILIHLLNNAYDAIEETPQNKEKYISIACRQEGDSIIISITNSGFEISEQVKEKLFQPFFTTKEIGKGTGLGLSISKNIAQHHGGDLFLDPGLRTTTFNLKLPLKQKKVELG